MSKIDAIRDLRALVPSLCLVDAKRFIETATQDYLADVERTADQRVQMQRDLTLQERNARQCLQAQLERERDVLHAAQARIRALEEALTQHVLGQTLLPSIGHTSFPDDALPF